MDLLITQKINDEPIMHHSFLVLAESVGWSSPTIIPLNIRIITNKAGISNKDAIIL